MAKEPKGEFSCYRCTKRDCRKGYPNGIPSYCIATRYADILEASKEKYQLPQEGALYKASALTTVDGYGKWPRVQTAIEFAKELNLKKIGLACCMAMINEMGIIGEWFRGAGFEVISAGCQVGSIQPEERGYPELKGLHSTSCNPIAQAEILNREGTELNFMLGLCLGHDIIFTKYAHAPSSTLIVKDRVTGHNPIAALQDEGQRCKLDMCYGSKAAD